MIDKIAQQWLQYYTTSLRDSDIVEITSNEIKNRIPFDNFTQLNNSSLLQKTFKVALKQLKKEKKEQGTDDISDLQLAVYIAPFHVVTEQKDIVFPFWIPALLLPTGELCPPEESNEHPWFIRSVLEPIYKSNSTLCLGTLSKTLEVLDKYQFNYNNWEGYWESCSKFFTKITKTNLDSFALSNASIVHEYSMVNANKKISAWAIQHLYQGLLKSRKLPKLLNHILTSQDQKQKPTPPTEESFLEMGHYGQYNNKFPLSLSQRESLLTFIRDKEDTPTSVLAVNGPPGTGKTTLLQSVVANEFVVSALRGSKPQRMVASSTNNKAITNILNSFSSSADIVRWLPSLNSLGSYMIAGDEEKRQQAIADGYQLLMLNENRLEGFYFDLYESERIKLPKLKQYYINSYCRFYDTADEPSVKRVVTKLYNLLKQKSYQIDHILGHYRKRKKFESTHELTLTDVAGLQEELSRLQEVQERLEKERLELTSFKSSTFDPFFQDNKAPILSRLFNSSNKQYNNRVQLFLSTTPFATIFQNCETREDAEAVLLALSEKLNRELSALKKKISQCSEIVEKCINFREGEELIKKELQDIWSKFLANKGEGAAGYNHILNQTDSDEERINIILDLTLRYESFILAVHYWEGKWLIDQEKNGPFTNTQGQDSRIDCFRRISYLTPLFVSTFHMLPSYCRYYKKEGENWEVHPIYELFDTFIVDEAGQVAPEIGIPSMAFAKHALIVGDIHQIEPVWNITSPIIDKTNLKSCNLLSDSMSYETWRKKGILSSSGNLMCLAQNASAYSVLPNLGGTMLVEHRRCVDELVAFSNESVYNGLLKPLVGSKGIQNIKVHNKPLQLPPYGYVNVRSRSDNSSGSVFNITEAKAIANWIRSYESHILELYAKEKDGEKRYKPIEECIAIITPFTAQARTIKNALYDAGINANIGVGTVHTFQGAEVPIVIFSATYGANHGKRRLFFDAGYNMLNVAITRAKDHFIVFGNMNLFQANGSKKPSSILAKYLFSSDDNQMSEGFLYTIFKENRRLNSLERHQQCLKYSIEKASKQVIIVSPFISIYAIEADNLEPTIQQAIERGVQVKVYTDAFLDIVDGKLKESSRRGRKLLQQLGVELHILKGIHNKAVAMDNQMLAEGSFNWLSALRDRSHSYYREDVSHVLTGGEASQNINELISDLNAIESEGK